MKEHSTKGKADGASGIRRRSFVKAAATVGAGISILPASTVFTYAANSAPGLGIIGLGGRGTYDGGEFLNNTDVRITALHDIFEDKVKAARASFDQKCEAKGYGRIPDSGLFTGHRGFEKLVASKDVDLVLVTSPPYFHPEHLEASVAAGKHVYLEKPVATDVAGCMRVLKAGKQADGQLSVHVGFQKRYDVGYRNTVERIHAGEIGPIVLGQTFYYTNDLGRQNKPGMSDLEARIRNWVFDMALSGDIIVEQNIHIVDIVNWALKSHPVKASGTSGRALRKQVDGIPASMLTSDHYILTYTYPGDVHVSFNSNQFRNKGYRQQGERFFGVDGFAETMQSGPATITLNQVREGQKTGDRMDAGKVDLHLAVGTKMKALVESIKSGKYENQVEQGVETTLTSILGRIAATSGREITWERMVKSNESWNLKLDLDTLS
ncbi:MAG: gfo/Idh/MocA family oxidoreductase [Acidobacteria bacterium]|nr:gfo/Idh/MocA family oxidoreductase [Acidobacteriota bacterium]